MRAEVNNAKSKQTPERNKFRSNDYARKNSPFAKSRKQKAEIKTPGFSRWKGDFLVLKLTVVTLLLVSFRVDVAIAS